MIISSCPLRISLFGGSTDNPYFVERYGFGSVISFTCDMKTYITLHADKIGYNTQGHKYIINYSRREEVGSIKEIQNEVIRVVLEHFDCSPLTLSMTSDSYSQGSGLASSSSYIISLIKGLSIFNNIPMTDIEICELAYNLERKINIHCGFQDPYGCGIGGFKQIDFNRDGTVKYNFLSTEFFKKYDAHLIFTGITRTSKNILSDVTDNIDKAYPLLETVDNAYSALKRKDYSRFLELINHSWEQKKFTSSLITENPVISQMDEMLGSNKSVLAHKLCGAGNGGFFLVFSDIGKLNIPYFSTKINVISEGITGIKL